MSATEPKSGSATIKLKPGETWVADQQCMVLHIGSYLADWLPYDEGFPFKNHLNYEIEINIDYGEPLETPQQSQDEKSRSGN